MYAYKIQLVKETRREYPDCSINNPELAAQLAAQYIGLSDREICVVMAVDTQNKITGIHTLSIGSLDASIIHPREVFKFAILSNACSIILVHNHPSGNIEPSPADKAITKRIKEASEIIGIGLHDHIIINYEGKYTSLKSQGII